MVAIDGGLLVRGEEGRENLAAFAYFPAERLSAGRFSPGIKRAIFRPARLPVAYILGGGIYTRISD